MHMLLRTILHAWISRFGKRIGHYDVAYTRFRVLPTDLDILRHMNNGVYLSIFDVGRFDMLPMRMKAPDSSALDSLFEALDSGVDPIQQLITEAE